MATLTQNTPLIATRFPREGSLRGLKARFDRWRAYRRTFDELQALSGRELADLGLSRGAIRRVALDSAYGPQD